MHRFYNSNAPGQVCVTENVPQKHSSSLIPQTEAQPSDEFERHFESRVLCPMCELATPSEADTDERMVARLTPTCH